MLSCIFDVSEGICPFFHIKIKKIILLRTQFYLILEKMICIYLREKKQKELKKMKIKIVKTCISCGGHKTVEIDHKEQYCHACKGTGKITSIEHIISLEILELSENEQAKKRKLR